MFCNCSGESFFCSCVLRLCTLWQTGFRVWGLHVLSASVSQDPSVLLIPSMHCLISLETNDTHLKSMICVAHIFYDEEFLRTPVESPSTGPVCQFTFFVLIFQDNNCASALFSISIFTVISYTQILYLSSFMALCNRVILHCALVFKQ